MESIHFPDISPVAFSVFGFAIYWYSFAYILGVLFGYLLIKHLNKASDVYTTKSLEDLVSYCVFGIVIGGRVGYVIFYDLTGVLSDPIRIFMIRNGGMSFHGGLLGMILAVYLVSYKHEINFLRAIDLISCVAPIGLFLGRIANFINAEMYGRITTVPWGIVFPGAGIFPRHPTQIYEAMGEGIFILILMLFLFSKLHKKPGALSGIFLVSYGIIRSLIELLKEPVDGYIAFLTTGQGLCVPMLIVGGYLLLLRSHTPTT